jgi:glycosyltransferase involved in cell wall biosynthesis
MAQWLTDFNQKSLDIEKSRRDLSDIWLDAFIGYSRICYELSSRIITLYGGNQVMQLRDGALPDRMQLIPNGVDVDLYGSIERGTERRRPTIALIGRVVQIKDVKTFIRAVASLCNRVPDLYALVLGPTEEDPVYFRECLDLVAYLNLEKCVKFTGKVSLKDYLGHVDAIVLTSVSEAQPLVMLEAGAAGVPSVATDVGACREIIEGRADESPPLGAGGFVTPLANPQATADALMQLLTQPQLRKRCGEVMRERTRLYYCSRVVHSSYASLYRTCMDAADQSHDVPVAI